MRHAHGGTSVVKEPTVLVRERTVEVDKGGLCRSHLLRSLCRGQLLVQSVLLDDGILLRVDEEFIELGQILQGVGSNFNRACRLTGVADHTSAPQWTSCRHDRGAQGALYLVEHRHECGFLCCQVTLRILHRMHVKICTIA